MGHTCAGAGDVRAEPGVVLFAAGFVAAAAGVCGDDGTVFAELLRDGLETLFRPCLSLCRSEMGSRDASSFLFR